MAPTTRLICQEDTEEWLDALRDLPVRFGHRPAFVSAAASALEHRGALGHRGALLVDDAAPAPMVCPLIIRPIGGTEWVDLATPIGFAGLINPNPETLVSTVRAVCPNAISGYLLIDNGFAASPSMPGLTSGPTSYCIDLTAGLDGLFNALGRDHRSRLRKWLTATDYHLVTDRDRLISAFPDLYDAQCKRQGTSQAYRFSPSGLREMFCDEGANLYGVAETDGEITAVALFGRVGARADYLLSAFSEGGRRHTRGLIWTALSALKDQEANQLDLGGGAAPDDSLALFKARFASRPQATSVLRLVFDEAGYRTCCNQVGVKATTDGWFPAYRRANLGAGTVGAR